MSVTDRTRGAGISVEDSVDELIASLNEDRDPDGLYHPSQIFGCLRATVFDLRGEAVTDPHSNRVRRRFRAGDLIEDLVREAIETTPDATEVISQFPVKYEGRVTGHGDLLVRRVLDGRWLVIEVKSTRTPPDRPDPRHVSQAQSYAAMAAREGRDIAGALLVYVGRDDLRMREFFWPFDAGWIVQLALKIDELDGYLAAGTVPDRPDVARNRKAAMCYGCPFMTRCWGASGVASARTRRAHRGRLAA